MYERRAPNFGRNFKMDAKNKNLPNVLVVDDNVILFRTVRDMLESNFNVSIAASGDQAFKAMSLQKPDIILLDYEMPDMDGEEIMKLLAENDATHDIPVIFLTSSASRDIVTRLIKLNPAGYILKPPNKQNMIEHIEQVLCPEKEEEISEQ